MSGVALDKYLRCLYCGNGDASVLCRCVECGKCFCNSGAESEPSHLLRHLLLRGHAVSGIKTCTGPVASVRGVPEFKCSVCECPNILLLRWKKRTLADDTNADIICRECDVDLEYNYPLVTHQRLDPAIVEHRVLNFSISVMDAKNAEFRRNAGDKRPDEEVIPLRKLPLAFSSGEDYTDIMVGHVKSEERTNRIRVRKGARWYAGRIQQDYSMGHFTFPCLVVKFDASEDKIMVRGQLVELTGTKGEEVITGRVIVVTLDKPLSEAVIDLSLTPAEEIAPHTHCDRFLIHESTRSATADRFFEAIRTWYRKVSRCLFHLLLGQISEAAAVCAALPPPEPIPAQFILPLNDSQRRAVASALQEPLTLIQGPPGTGKTTVSIAVVYHMYEMYKKPILVCAPSNVAADHLAQRLSKLGLKVLRVQAPSREHMPSELPECQLHNMVGEILDNMPVTADAKVLHMRYKNRGMLPAAELLKYRATKLALGHQIIRDSHIVCTTCSTAGHKMFKATKFHYVLIDEAAQAVEPETLIPLTHGAKKVVLVGDHRQMGPLVFNREASRLGYGRSLFERLQQLGATQPIMLETQYRMHPHLSRFPSQQFYGGLLLDGVTAGDRPAPAGLDWPVRGNPKFFCHVDGIEEYGANGKSYVNCAEVLAVDKALTRLLASGIAMANIGVISFYEAQRALLLRYLVHRHGADAIRELEVANVDSFQGREKRYIIVCCTRSNPRGVIGFLTDERRLNVTITRAQYGMVVIGNAALLSTNPVWHSLLQLYQDESVLGEPAEAPWGSLTDVTLSDVVITSKENDDDGLLYNVHRVNDD